MFLELSGLSAAAGAAYDSQYALTVQVQDPVAQQAQAPQSALATGMPPWELTVCNCEDETIHPAVCLVAIEEVSNRRHLARDVRLATADVAAAP